MDCLTGWRCTLKEAVFDSAWAVRLISSADLMSYVACFFDIVTDGIIETSALSQTRSGLLVQPIFPQSGATSR